MNSTQMPATSQVNPARCSAALAVGGRDESQQLAAEVEEISGAETGARKQSTACPIRLGMATWMTVLTMTRTATPTSTRPYCRKYAQKRPRVSRTARGLDASCWNIQSRWPITRPPPDQHRLWIAAALQAKQDVRLWWVLWIGGA